MQSAEEKHFVVIKLNDGEDLFESLERVISKHKITSGMFLGGVGMIQNFELGYWDGKEYLTEFHEKPHELIHFGGSIAHVNGKFMPHIHCAVAGPDHILKGGHLNKAEVAVLNEITILKLHDFSLTRKLNPVTGLMELEVMW